MSKRRELPLIPRTNNSDDFTQIRLNDDGTVPRDILLDVWLDSNGRFTISPYSEKGDFSARGRTWRTTLAFGEHDLFSFVDECRKQWYKCLINLEWQVPKKRGGSKPQLVFQNSWDLSKYDGIDLEVGKHLAVAGDKLYWQIFQSSDGKGLCRLGKRLAEISRSRPLVLNVQSSVFFVPWGLLYVHPDAKEGLSADGSNFEWDGFLGYRHIVEHNPDDAELDWQMQPFNDGRLAASFNYDNRIDARMRMKVIRKQQKFFKEHPRLSTAERKFKVDLQQAFEDKAFADQVLYFFCHGTHSGQDAEDKFRRGAIALSDDDADVRIDDQDIKYWRRKLGEFPSKPLVFINACEQGQLRSMYFDGLGIQFLKHHAVGVIGPQVEIPAVFADEFARRLFTKLLEAPKGKQEPARLGPLMRKLTTEFIEKHKNPLGLVYSLYRGIDCHVVPSTGHGKGDAKPSISKKKGTSR